MKTLRLIFVLCLGLFLAMAYGVAQAAEDSDEQTSAVSLTIPETAQLLIATADSSKTLGIDGDSETAFDAGYVELDAGKPTLTVDANKSWKLSAKSSGFGIVGSYTKDIGDLQLKDAGASHVTMGSYTSLSAVDQEVAVHTAGVSDESHPCQYKIDLDWTQDIPGTYEATVTYTLSTSP